MRITDIIHPDGRVERMTEYTRWEFMFLQNPAIDKQVEEFKLVKNALTICNN